MGANSALATAGFAESRGEMVTGESLTGEVRGDLRVRRSSAEQSNTSIIYGDRLILKLFRRFQAGPNPDCEVQKYLSERVHFARVPPFAGSIEYRCDGRESGTLAMLQGLVENEGDAWRWTLEEVERYYETCAPVPYPDVNVDDPLDLLELSAQPPTDLAREHVGLYLDAAAMLGRRTGEMHRALAEPTDDPAFAPGPFTAPELSALFSDLRQQATAMFDALKDSVSHLPDDTVEPAALVLSRRREILDRFRETPGQPVQTYGQRIRIHGDYHLGQVLRAKTDYIILDFEGEPARPLPERRAKQSALKDVAGMLRSFSYGAYATLMNWSARHGEDLGRLERWARLWERSTAAEFLRGYREATVGAAFLPSELADFRKLLDAYRLNKALYEVLYELNNRPAWVRIPLMGILGL